MGAEGCRIGVYHVPGFWFLEHVCGKLAKHCCADRVHAGDGDR